MSRHSRSVAALRLCHPAAEAHSSASAISKGSSPGKHGYNIAQAIRANSSDVLQVDTGSLYPALHRLERQKLVAAVWKISENKQRTRVYRLTAVGRQQLASERSKWDQLVEAIGGILSAARPKEA